MLIAFEGMEGSGKSTQAQRLSTTSKHHEYVSEPGGTILGYTISDLVKSELKLSNEVKFHLFMAGMLNNVNKIINFKDKNKQTILWDRSYISTVAHQQLEHEGFDDWVFSSQLVPFIPAIDLVLIFDINYETMINRFFTRARRLDLFEKYLVENKGYFTRLRESYRTAATRAKEEGLVGRVVVLDCNDPALSIKDTAALIEKEIAND